MGRMSGFGSFWECNRMFCGARGDPLAASAS